MNFNEYFFVNHDKKLVYFPVNKNASTTYIQFFKTKTEWEHIDKLPSGVNDYVWFSHIQNPRDRWVKGISEVLDTNKIYQHISDPALSVFLIRIYHDNHVTSLKDLFNDEVMCINFIPMSDKTEQTTYDFLQTFGVEYPDLLKLKRMNVSKRRKKVIHEKIRSIINTYPKAKKVFENRIHPFYYVDRELWETAKRNVGKWPYAPTVSMHKKHKQEILDMIEKEKRENQEIEDMTFWQRLTYAINIVIR